MCRYEFNFHCLSVFSYKDGHTQLIETSLTLAQAYSSTGDEDGEGKEMILIQ